MTFVKLTVLRFWELGVMDGGELDASVEARDVIKNDVGELDVGVGAGDGIINGLGGNL